MLLRPLLEAVGQGWLASGAVVRPGPRSWAQRGQTVTVRVALGGKQGAPRSSGRAAQPARGRGAGAAGRGWAGTSLAPSLWGPHSLASSSHWKPWLLPRDLCRVAAPSSPQRPTPRTDDRITPRMFAKMIPDQRPRRKGRRRREGAWATSAPRPVWCRIPPRLLALHRHRPAPSPVPRGRHGCAEGGLAVPNDALALATPSWGPCGSGGGPRAW